MLERAWKGAGGRARWRLPAVYRIRSGIELQTAGKSFSTEANEEKTPSLWFFKPLSENSGRRPRMRETMFGTRWNMILTDSKLCSMPTRVEKASPPKKQSASRAIPRGTWITGDSVLLLAEVFDS